MEEVHITLLVAAIAALFGALGYLIATFWVQPVLCYRSIKYRVISDLIFYRDVINANGLNASMKQRLEKRVEANRRGAADFAATLIELPGWYKCWLHIRGVDIQHASSEFIGLSNTYEYGKAADKILEIQKLLKIKSPIVS